MCFAKVDPIKIEKAAAWVFDLRPLAIINELDLRRPIYKVQLGHFSVPGRIHLGAPEPRPDARLAVSSSNHLSG